MKKALVAALGFAWVLGVQASPALQTADALIESRVVNWDGVANVRDLGGLAGLDGRLVRMGRIYRSAGLNANAHFRGKDRKRLPKSEWRGPGVTLIKPETVRYVVDTLGVKTDLDLRNDAETFGMTESPLGASVRWVRIPSSNYEKIAKDSVRQAFVECFKVFLDEKNYPILFHCKGGADRTGSLACILNGLLGVEEDLLYRDWRYTWTGSFKKPVPEEAWGRLMGVFAEYEGNTLNARIEKFVLSCGIAHENIEKFRSLMLEEQAESTASCPDRSDLYAQAIETAVAKGHPRLFADADAFAALKASVGDGTLRARAIGKVIERAEFIVGEPPLTRVMYGHRMLRTSRAALGRISTLAMAHRLSGDGRAACPHAAADRRFLDRAVVELKAVCAFEDWNPRHFLDTAEMSFAVALGYDWLYHDLPEDVRTELLNALVEKGFRPAQKGGNWARTGTNWAQVCRGAAIALSLVLADRPDMRGDCVRMLKASVKALHKPMDLLEPDGCYPEGVGYWRYGISFNVYAIAMMESACGTDFGLLGKNGFRKTAEYPNLATGPLGMTIGYSDCGTSRGALPVLWWFARRFGRPDLLTEHEVRAWDAAPEGDGHYPPVELFWMDGRKGGTVPSSLPLVWEGRGKVPIAVLRSGFGAEDAFVGLKGGRPRTNHGHMDGGNFVLDMGGVRWAWDLPAEYYPRIEEMGTVSLWKMDQESSRWSLLRLNTFGHNVPQVAGAQQAVDGFASFTVVTNVPEPTGEMDLSSLYPAAKKVVRRCTLAPDGKRFAVQDVFDGLVPGTEVTWKFITKAGARADGGRLALTESGRTLEAVRDGTAATEWKIASAEGPKPLNSPNPGFSVISFSVKSDESGRACAAVVFSRQ